MIKQESFWVLDALVTVYKPSSLKNSRMSSCLTIDSADDKNPLPVVVLCPGGGYQKYGISEALPVAEKLCGAGFYVFILSYAIGDTAADALPLKQLSQTVATIRENHSHFGINPNQISAMGFSAGGHLAASLGTLWNHPILSDCEGKNRPDALCLCYPVISLKTLPHKGTNMRLLVGSNKKQFENLLSAELNVTDKTPPTFLWHSIDDSIVDVDHSIIFSNALKKAGVFYKLKLFEHGVHGCALADEMSPHPNKEVSSWFSDWLDFIKDVFSK